MHRRSREVSTFGFERPAGEKSTAYPFVGHVRGGEVSKVNMWGVQSTLASTMSGTESARQSSSGRRGSFDAESVLGKDDFLKLLVTQLTYQDPINPVGDQEFIAQLAQFSALEQMHNVATQIERLADAQLLTGGMGQAASMLGRTVVLFDADIGDTVEGVIEAVRFEDGMPVLIVDGRRFSLYDVVEVRGSE